MKPKQMEAHRTLLVCASICSLILPVLLGACGGSNSPAAPTASYSPIPATLTPPVETAASPISTNPIPTDLIPPTDTPSPTAALPACIPGLTYISDVTIPDNTVVAPGSQMDKQWVVQNSGTCDWDANYRLRLVSGDGMGVQEQLLYPARSGVQVMLQMDLTAPLEPGWYSGTWQAVAPDGSSFGDVITIAILVQ